MEKSQKKVVITGGSGLLAVNTAYIKRDDWDICLIAHTKNIEMDRVSIVKIDLEEFDEALKSIKAHSPDVIIHMAGLTSVEECENKKYKARSANVITARNISNIAKDIGAKFVHISTDHFSNEDVKYSNEQEISIPINYYSQTKLEAEYEVQKIIPNALIIRTNFFGWGHGLKQSFSDYIIKNLRKENEIELFDDVYFTPILIDDLIVSIDSLLNLSKSGIYNIVSDKRISKYDFGKLVAKVFELDKSLIKKGKITSRSDLVKRPLDMSLSNKKIKKDLKIDSIPLEDSIVKLKNQEFNGRKSDLKNVVTTKDKVIGYGKQTIDDYDIESVIKVLNSPFLTQGPIVKKFEDRYASYVGAKYAVAVSSLTAGLHIACLAAGLKKEDGLLTSPNSFCASSNCALYVGATPYFSDIDPISLNIAPKEVLKTIKNNKSIKVIVPVHFAGHPCDMKALSKIAKENNLIIIEDAAQGLGGKYSCGDRIGSCKYSLITGTSFHPVKSITTGEGGMLTTNDSEIYHQLLRLRSHGITKSNDQFIIKDQATTDNVLNPWYMEMQQIGYNYRISDFQCALGLSQLRKIDGFIKRRVEICKKYDSDFKNLENCSITQESTRGISANHLYVLSINLKKIKKTKPELFSIFRKYGVGLHVHHIPIPMHPYYQNNLKFAPYSYKNCMDYYKSAITLPVFPTMTDQEVNQVINAVKNEIG